MSLHSDNILLIKITTKKSTGFRCFSFAQKEETHGNQNQQRNTQLQGNRLLWPGSAAAHLFAAGGGYGGGLYFTLRGVLDRETLGWLCIVGAAPMAAAGFFHYNGLTLEQFLWAWCKTNFLLAGRRLWHSENYLYDLWEEDKK